MKNGCIFTECAVILGVAVVLGTAVHLFRPEKLRLKFIGDYPLALQLRESPPAVEPPPKTAPIEEPPSEGKTPRLSKQAAKPGAGDPTQAKLVPTGVGKDAATPIPGAKASPPEGKPAAQSVAKSGVPEIGVDEAYEFFKNDAPFLDARRTRFYLQGHVLRAKAMSVWEADLDKRISDLLSEVPLDLPMVIYCTGGDCEDSHMLAGKLKQAGFTNLHIFLEGFPKWVEKKYPVEKSEAEGQDPAGGEEGR